MGSGKSKVSSYLKKKYPVLDCDRVNANLLEKGEEGYQCLRSNRLVSLLPDGTIDKKALASKMFEDTVLKERVESILHPLIVKKMQEWIDRQDVSMVFVEVPLLFESQMENLFDSIWCVVASQETALHRLCTYRHFTTEQAKARLAFQMDPQQKMRRSSQVIFNDGTLEDLKQNIRKALKKEEYE